MFLYFMLLVMIYTWFAYRKHLREDMWVKEQIGVQKRLLQQTYTRNYRNHYI